jgi:hypothetical protein
MAEAFNDGGMVNWTVAQSIQSIGSVMPMDKYVLREEPEHTRAADAADAAMPAKAAIVAIPRGAAQGSSGLGGC